ncbi:hypothetical protein JOY44_03335 [Phormidium sp. CLA17]|uniref:hypothetical protein n=1 Tax=Leptolyngbya sp. Cla-17 TaxID=2803751 RepID=UPI0014921CF9|nr:hypothetical protein [Leptolyngbya sp. Cla-17]MBM0740659.1 hypothetical protein [Leptolyngbya sp. Cla-17]
MNSAIAVLHTILSFRLGILAIIIAVPNMPAIAQEANFGKVALSTANPVGRLSGSTGGSISLPAIINNVDYRNNRCLGFGDSKPDHILTLEQNFPSLSVRVSSGSDTTLVVQGADGTVRCGDDTGVQKDASVVDSNWKAGIYRIWVGSAKPGTQRDYRLTIQP